MPEQTLTLDDLKMTVRLNGSNVILRFEQDDVTPEPFIWGFSTIKEFREYLGMLNTFNKSLAKVKRSK